MSRKKKKRKNPRQYEWDVFNQRDQTQAYLQWLDSKAGTTVVVKEKPAPVYDPALPTVVVTQTGKHPGQVARRFASFANVYVASPHMDEEMLGEVYSKASHLVLSGGPDIDPAYYRQNRTHAERGVPDRDIMEFKFLQLALTDGMPVMGICRGHQLMSVFHGMQLFQDVQKNSVTDRSHRSVSHAVHFQSNTGLWYTSVGKSSILVNSLHHQSVMPSTIPNDWYVTSYSDDGLIEGLQHKDKPLVGIQSHPELMRVPWTNKLFRNFLSWA